MAVDLLRVERHPSIYVAFARPQLLPNDARYRDELRELSDVGTCDVLIDISDEFVDVAYRSPNGFAFRLSWMASNDGRLLLYAVLALTAVEHFVLGCASWASAWVGVGRVWPEERPPAGITSVKDTIVAFSHAVHDLFVKERLPREALAVYGKCGEHNSRLCTCKFEVVALRAIAERTRLAAAGVALRASRDPPGRIAAAALLLDFPVMPALPYRPTSASLLPRASISSATAAAWEAACEAGGVGVASLPLWSWLLAPELIAALASGPSGLLGILTEEIPGAAWSFPVFSPAGCAAIIDATEQAEGFKDRCGVCFSAPNTMNRFGVIMRQCGLAPFMRSLLHAVLTPMAEVTLPLESLPGGGFMRIHSFIVAYDAQEGCDKSLDMHTDASDVTFNICLGKEFTGATLSLCGAKGANDHRSLAKRYEHVPGRCVIHRGLQRHGADAIVSGHRRNLIVWLSNDILGTLPCRQAKWLEEVSVDPVCLSYTHDHDYEARGGAALPPGAVRGPAPWCPEVACSDVRLK